MTDYVAICRDAARDTITATGGGAAVALYPSGSCESVYLSPAAARTFARGILALADEVDGGELAAPKLAVEVGDRVKVVADDFATHVGKTGILKCIDDGETATPFCVKFDGAAVLVWVSEVRGIDEPTATPADTNTSPESYRASLLEQARTLVGSRDVPQLLAVARFLAGESA